MWTLYIAQQASHLNQRRGASPKIRTNQTANCAHLLGHPTTSVLIDQLIAMKPVIQVLFSRKMPGYIWDVVNPEDCKILMTSHAVQRGVEEPETRCQRHVRRHLCSCCVAVTLPSRGILCSSSPFRGKQTSRTKSAHHRSPIPAPTRGSRDGNGWCFYLIRFGKAARKCDTDYTYQENE